MNKSGKNYEEFVRKLQQAILSSNQIINQKNIVIEKNKKIKDNTGIEREFDLYWEYELGGVLYKTVIECKDYNSKISIDRIDSFIGKLRDFPGYRGVFATRVGYQSGAEAKAIANNIDLLIAREQNDSDWCDKDGNDYIKQVHLDMNVTYPAQIVDFLPAVDKKWIEETQLEFPNRILINGKSDEIFLEEMDSKLVYSLHDLKKELVNNSLNGEELCSIKKKLTNTYLVSNNQRLKLESYEIIYLPEREAKFPIVIDFEKELFGVIEYLNRGIKKSVFRGGKIIDEIF